MTSKQQQWQQRQVAAGRCRTCGKKVSDGGVRCKYHRRLHSAYERNRRAKARALVQP